MAVIPRPRGGDWLDDEIRRMRLGGVDVLVSLLTDEEVGELDFTLEPADCARHGVEYVRFPIPDRTVPSHDGVTAEFLEGLADRVQRGLSVAVHCRMGLGRSALVVACVMGMLGENVESAFAAIADARAYDVPDTEEQRQWAKDFLRSCGD